MTSLEAKGPSSPPGSSPLEKKFNITMARVHDPWDPLIQAPKKRQEQLYFLPAVYFLGVRIEGKERAGAFWERNSKSESEKCLTSASCNFCTAAMQSIDVDPEPTHVGLSVQWLPFATELIEELPLCMFKAAPNAMFMTVE